MSRRLGQHRAVARTPLEHILQFLPTTTTLRLCSISKKTRRMVERLHHPLLLYRVRRNSLSTIDSLKKMQLKTCMLTYHVPGSLGEVFESNALDLSDRDIGTPLYIIGHLSNLTVLNLSNNHIREFYDSFYLLINLVELDLSDNRLAMLPQQFRNFQLLRKLKLSRNKFVHFPRIVRKLPELIELHLGDNELETVVLHHPRLQVLILESNFIFHIELRLPRLRMLSLDNNDPRRYPCYTKYEATKKEEQRSEEH